MQTFSLAVLSLFLIDVMLYCHLLIHTEIYIYMLMYTYTYIYWIHTDAIN